MNVSLTPSLETYINAKIESGLYASASEVIRAALRRMIEVDIENNILQGIERGLSDLQAGRVTESKACFEAIRTRLVQK